MKKIAYVIALFLMFTGGFFGYYMRVESKKEPIAAKKSQAVILKEPVSNALPQTEVSATEHTEAPFLVRAERDELLIYGTYGSVVLHRLRFLPERLEKAEREALSNGIFADSEEEALMIAEAFVN